jgi:signal transduction histidine kinase
MDSTLDRLAARLDDERRLSDKVAHQLRNGLTALRLQVEVAAMTAGEGEQRAALDRVVGQVDRLDATITELTAVTRLDPGATAPVASVVDERVAFWQPSFERAGRPVHVDVEVAAADAVVDGGAAGQAIDVLVENALRHGGGALVVQAQRRGDHAVVAVADDGPGIPDELVRSVFERGVSGAGGTGLGLAIAREALAARGGRLELVQRRPARFEAWLPAGSRDSERGPKGET